MIVIERAWMLQGRVDAFLRCNILSRSTFFFVLMVLCMVTSVVLLFISLLMRIRLSMLNVYSDPLFWVGLSLTCGVVYLFLRFDVGHHKT